MKNAKNNMCTYNMYTYMYTYIRVHIICIHISYIYIYVNEFSSLRRTVKHIFDSCS